MSNHLETGLTPPPTGGHSPVRVQGENDVWGIQDEVEEMVARLPSRNATVEYLVLENEGRSIQHWENQLRFYRALESFLAKHLGGGVSPITADEMWIGVK